MTSLNPPYFSILIPVYNTEKYIARCLDSCIHQSFKEIEILIIDDCGKDSSIEIAQQYKDKDPRIKIIHNKHNLGTFHSYIAGTQNAKGQYIIPLDSDDFITLDACEKIFEAIQKDYNHTKQYADICCFGIDFHPKTLKRKRPKTLQETKINHEILKAIFIDSQTPPWGICGKAYKKQILQKTDEFIMQNLHHLPRLVMAEDLLKSFILSLFAQKSIGLSSYLYYYSCSETSITQSSTQQARETKISNIKTVINTINNLQSNTNLPKNPYLHQAIQKTTSHLHSIIELESRYNHSFFAYPKACIQSLRYYHKWQTYIRLSLYFLTFGKIKL